MNSSANTHSPAPLELKFTSDPNHLAPARHGVEALSIYAGFDAAAGYECGIGLSDYQDLRPGDIIETFELREIPRT